MKFTIQFHNFSMEPPLCLFIGACMFLHYNIEILNEHRFSQGVYFTNISKALLPVPFSWSLEEREKTVLNTGRGTQEMKEMILCVWERERERERGSCRPTGCWTESFRLCQETETTGSYEAVVCKRSPLLTQKQAGVQCLFSFELQE